MALCNKMHGLASEQGWNRTTIAANRSEPRMVKAVWDACGVSETLRVVLYRSWFSVDPDRTAMHKTPRSAGARQIAWTKPSRDGHAADGEKRLGPARPEGGW